MPAARTELRAGRGAHRHREATVPPAPALAPAHLAGLSAPECDPVLTPAADAPP